MVRMIGKKHSLAAKKPAAVSAPQEEAVSAAALEQNAQTNAAKPPEASAKRSKVKSKSKPKTK